MSDGATITLVGDQTRRVACQAIMRAPIDWTVSIEPPRRTLDQSRRFWATCSDIANSGLEWSGTPHSKIDWHTLLLSGWCVARGRPSRLVGGLEGELVNLAPHSSRLSKSQMAELIDYCSAWAAMHGVELRGN